jgi:hypothetical protein
MHVHIKVARIFTEDFQELRDASAGTNIDADFQVASKLFPPNQNAIGTRAVLIIPDLTRLGETRNILRLKLTNPLPE